MDAYLGVGTRFESKNLPPGLLDNPGSGVIRIWCSGTIRFTALLEHAGVVYGKPTGDQRQIVISQVS